MKQELSILIPTYNGDCRQQVAELGRQAEAIDGLRYEIIVADDGSPDRHFVDLCSEVSALPHCRFIDRKENRGRAAIRNFLAREAIHEWLLFMDCDMTIVSETFVKDYLDADVPDVAYGGYVVGTGDSSCLRYIYERKCASMHLAEERRKRPFMHFHTSNFMVRREVMLCHPFDERFRHYGYEDVLWGKMLREAGIEIVHLDNPAGFFTYEDNAHFVSKTEEGLRTLHQFRTELRGYSQMISFTDKYRLADDSPKQCNHLLLHALRLLYRLCVPLMRRNLCGNRPSLRIFKIYKLLYFVSIEKKG
jgi:glycosyltransferase involved in cell wall biosynthesis